MKTRPGSKELLRGRSPLVLIAFAAACATSPARHVATPTWQTAVEADLRKIHAAVMRFAELNAGRYPEDLQMLVIPDANGATYLERTTLPMDPWGRPYGYEAPIPGNAGLRVFTLGRDGRTGGDGEDGDVECSVLTPG